MTPRPALPIDSLLPEIERVLRGGSNLVIEAAPGAGKTTRVPPALLALVPGQVLVLEPRRIAARLAARRVAAEMGEPVGGTVGYQVRFEEVGGPQTRLRFLTEGVLTRRLLSDPDLEGVDAVVLDEFHERHLDTDLALALLRRLQTRRPALKLVVMSATLEAGPVATFLGGCPVLRSEGRSFALQVQHTPYLPQPLEVQVRAALEELLLRDGHTGHVLVFLPGAAEIRRALRECAALGQRTGAALLPLHGDLPPEEQDLAVAPSTRQKVIFSTNLAESSVTIDGVTAVIDSGLARIASHSPWTGLRTLELGRVSRASAVQRAGRAGRTAPGVAVRLYPQEDFAQRPAFAEPEILRDDLAGLCLALQAMGFRGPEDLAWLDAPAGAPVEHAQALLRRLGVTAASARAMSRLPVPPRLARMLLEAERRGCVEQAITVAALLGSDARLAADDLLEALDRPLEGNALRQRQQLQRLMRPRGKAAAVTDEALLLSVLAGFPDRVARRRSGTQVVLSNGVAAELSREAPYEFMVVLDAESRSDRPLPLVRLTARIEPEWLLDLFPDDVRDQCALAWNRRGERVEEISTLRFGELVLDETRGPASDAVAAADLLTAQALEAGVERFVDGEALSSFNARLAFAGLPAPDVPGTLRQLAQGLRSFAELRDAAGQLLPILEAEAGAALRELAPVSLRLPNGRPTPVHYEEGKPPWIASRLQDFFGLRETPRLGRHRIPVVVHLLAPNRRPVQTTTDLAGFWERLYPQVRRELMRRYPRHPWPQRPETGGG